MNRSARDVPGSGSAVIAPALGASGAALAGAAAARSVEVPSLAVPVDELGMRTGSVPSLVLTIVGLYLRRSGGWLSTAALVRLASDAGAAPGLTRSAFTRLKQRGVLVAARPSGVAGYAFAEGASRMFERGDRRIFAPRRMALGDAWSLLSFSLPEQQRGLRAQLRRRLQGIGCGIVAPGLWIAPGYLAEEIEEILVELAVRGSAVLFDTDDPRPAEPLADAVASWWDLPAIAARHEEFLRVLAGLPAVSGPTAGPGSELAEAAAFRRYVLAVDAWRDIPYVDPGLPLELLPDDWPGRRSIPAFLELSERDADSALRHVVRVRER
ncbi:PaaX family transcriptional regulator [Schumannella soli]|uniref:Regulator n=1 Tax=Schumannella soli TaxID=2590779 RepID=A0A506Y7D3_9MICO|nr:PaaX family transcriptional regulator C-terminal domain-containing protein [Schumannella soli]TPW77430.1 regulator [Schumannella soli]